MSRRPLTALAALAVGLLAVLPATTAAATQDGQVCVGLDSGKINTTGDPLAVTASAPTGQVVTGYCVKAGSINQGLGPEYVTLAAPVRTVVIRHSSGKAVSHYALSYGPATPAPTPDPQPNPQPNPDPQPNPKPFDWNWTYPDPACDSLTVTYPADLPAGQSNDVNIRIRTSAGETTLNYHLDHGTWSGTQGFVYSQHPRWPAGVTAYEVVWIQVAGTNYHYGESFHNAPIAGPVRCRINADGDPETVDIPQAVSRIIGWRAASAVRRGAAAPATTVLVAQPGVTRMALQRRTPSTGWRAHSSVAVVDQRAWVRFPKERRAGVVRYRLVLPGTIVTTGATTTAMKVRVRR